MSYFSVFNVKFSLCYLKALYTLGRGKCLEVNLGSCFPVGKIGTPVRPSFAISLLCDLREVPVL